MRIKANEEREKQNQGGRAEEQIESVNQVMTATVTLSNGCI